MSDDDIRQALRERLTRRRTFVVERVAIDPDDRIEGRRAFRSDPRVGSADAPATLDALLWGINQTNALTERTRDDLDLLKRYAADISADALPPDMRDLPIGYDSIAEMLTATVNRLVSITPRATPPPPTDAEIRAIIAEHLPPGSASPDATNETPEPINPRAFRRKGLQQFTYWDDDRLDPAIMTSHNDLNASLRVFVETTPRVDQAAEYEQAAKTDPGAFRAFLAADLHAIDAEWVRAQLKAWALAGRPDLVESAMGWWARASSSLTPPDLARTIWRDQWIYLRVSRWREQGLTKGIATKRAQRLYRQRHGERPITASTVTEVCFEYDQQLRRWLRRWPIEQWPVSPRMARLHFMRAMTRRLRELSRLLAYPLSE
jgi:hypothetical protein